MIARAVAGAALLILASCNAEVPTKREIRDEANGVSLIVEHLDGPALSQSEDKIFLITGNDRTLVFEGYGGTKLSLLPSKKGLLIVSYCGGAVRSTESFVVNDDKSGQAVAVKVQPIIAPGIEVDGKPACENVAEAR